MGLRLATVSSSAMSQAQSDEVARLCGRVFNVDYAYLMSLCPARIHVLGYLDGQLVAHALWLERRMRIGDGPWVDAAYVEGVAAHPDHRRRGHGEAVMRRLQAEIHNYPFGALSPAVEPWYAKLGWERWRGQLWIYKGGEMSETLDETVLVYRTPRTGTLDLTLALTAEWRPFELW